MTKVVRCEADDASLPLGKFSTIRSDKLWLFVEAPLTDSTLVEPVRAALAVDYINDNPERLGALLHALAVQAASAWWSASANISVSPPSGSRDLAHAIAQGAADLLTHGIAHDPGDEPHSSRWG